MYGSIRIQTLSLIVPHVQGRPRLQHTKKSAVANILLGSMWDLMMLTKHEHDAVPEMIDWNHDILD